MEGRFFGLKIEKTLFEELAKDRFIDYKTNDNKSLSLAERSIKHLKIHFKGYRPSSITAATIKEHKAERVDSHGQAHGTNYTRFV